MRTPRQDSRTGPAADVVYMFRLGRHHGIGFLADYADTDTRLADFALNTWTMTWVVFAPEYM